MEPSVLDLEKVYENNSQLKREDVKILQEWMHSKKFYISGFDDIEIIFFLTACNYDVEKTKERITGATFFRSRSKIFQDIDFRGEELKAAMDTV